MYLDTSAYLCILLGEDGSPRVNAQIDFQLTYKLAGDEPIAEGDLSEFSNTNGPYHSWPFLRQLLFDLCARMDFPALTLPVLQILPTRPKELAKEIAEPPPGGSPQSAIEGASSAREPKPKS